VDLVPRTLGVKPALPIEQSQPHAIFRLCTRCLKTPRSSRVVDAWRTATGGCRITAELVTAGYQSMELDAFPLPVDFMIRGSRTLQAHICRRRMCYRMVCRLSRSVSFDPVRRAGMGANEICLAGISRLQAYHWNDRLSTYSFSESGRDKIVLLPRQRLWHPASLIPRFLWRSS